MGHRNIVIQQALKATAIFSFAVAFMVTYTFFALTPLRAQDIQNEAFDPTLKYPDISGHEKGMQPIIEDDNNVSSSPAPKRQKRGILKRTENTPLQRGEETPNQKAAEETYTQPPINQTKVPSEPPKETAIKAAPQSMSALTGDAYITEMSVIPPKKPRNLISNNKSKHDDNKGSVTMSHQATHSFTFKEGESELNDYAITKLDKDIIPYLHRHANTNARILSVASGGEENSTSYAKRIALSRALITREYLLNKGISSARIDLDIQKAKNSAAEPNRIDVIIE